MSIDKPPGFIGEVIDFSAEKERRKREVMQQFHVLSREFGKISCGRVMREAARENPELSAAKAALGAKAWDLVYFGLKQAGITMEEWNTFIEEMFPRPDEEQE